MKKRFLVFALTLSAVVFSLLVSTNANSNSSRCRQSLLNGCASGNDCCYYWIEDTGEKCIFDHSIFVDM